MQEIDPPVMGLSCDPVEGAVSAWLIVYLQKKNRVKNRAKKNKKAVFKKCSFLQLKC